MLLRLESGTLVVYLNLVRFGLNVTEISWYNHVEYDQHLTGAIRIRRISHYSHAQINGVDYGELGLVIIAKVEGLQLLVYRAVQLCGRI